MTVHGLGGTIRALKEGVPAHGVVGLHDYNFYRFDVVQLDALLEVSLTTFSGDADMYASFFAPRPTIDSYNFSSSLSSGRMDSLRISPNDPLFCRSTPCQFFVSVYGFRNSSYSLLASQSISPRVVLVDGQPQQSSLEGQNWAFYTFNLNGAVDSFQVDVSPQFGDPDVYVSHTVTRLVRGLIIHHCLAFCR